MKKNKLNLEKFKIVQLSNPKSMDEEDKEDGTVIVNPDKGKCKEMSDVIIHQ